MARRRGNQEGTVFQDGAGIWWAQLPPDEAGKRPRRRAKTQKEALEKLRELQKNRSAGVMGATGHLTVGQFLATWLEQSAKPSVKPSTYESYTEVVRLYLTPDLGSYRLDKFGPAQVQKWQNALLERLSPRTVQYARRVLRKALAVAQRWGYVSRNVVDLVDPPRVEKYHITPLTVAQVEQLINAVAGHRLAALYLVTVLLGLRRGEVLGLRWADIDWNAETLRIVQTIQQSKGGLRTDTPKTKSSARTLPLPPDLIDALRTHWHNQQEERALLGPEWKEHGLVFASAVGTPISPRNLVTNFKRLLAAAGLPQTTRFHDLRHTAATLLIERGVHPKIISAILGHSSIQITMDIYGHAGEDATRAGIEQVAQVLKGRKKA